MSNERKSFVEILGATSPNRQKSNLRSPLLGSGARGFGTTDTLPQTTRLFAQAEDAHMDAVVHRKNKSIFNPSEFYLLEDAKSRAGTSYKQTDYVVVTREEGHTPDFGLIARRAK